MSFTIFGLLVLAICTPLLIWRSPLALLIALMFFSLMGGSAAIVIPALGNASIQPAVFGLVFLCASAFLPGRYRSGIVPEAVLQNIYLVFFCIFGFVAALTLPFIFSGAMEVAPMTPIVSRDMFAVTPLRFAPENITTGVYLLGTMAAALCAYIAMKRANAHLAFAKAAALVGLLHAFLGLSDFLLSGTGYEEFLAFFRNAKYSQTDHTIAGLSRMNGILPEASEYANVGFIWLVLCFELWLRGFYPRLTGAAAALLLIALVFSLSSTAFVALGGYGAVLLLRAFFTPGSIRGRNTLALMGAGALALLCVAATSLFAPSFANTLARTFADLTVEKSESFSGMQRMFWARQGIDAFFVSWGLGVGPGSFRSSSILTAILGSMGVFGLVTFTAHLASVLKAFRFSTYYTHRQMNPRNLVGAAASWTVIALLIPRSVSAPSPDPGLVFGLLSGVALCLRAAPAFASSHSVAHS
ncbi:glycoside hydrolase [Marinicaulis aureus]|uniref:Glycoside hydrolase n=1 Tax=Hyphococcus aureus TaxID=2666033 RepID=A0ABW1KZK9_9PROT